MAIAFDAVASKSSDASGITTINWAHVIGSGSNRFLLIGIVMANTAVSVSSVTVGLQNATFLRADANSTWVRNEIWYLVNPTTGSQTITVNISGSGTYGIACGSCSYSGVDQSSPIDTSAQKTAFSNHPNVDITLAGTNEWAFILSGWITSNTVNSHDSGQTHRFYEHSGDTFNNSSDGDDISEASAGAKNYQLTLSGNWFWECQAVAFKPVAVPVDWTKTVTQPVSLLSLLTKTSQYQRTLTQAKTVASSSLKSVTKAPMTQAASVTISYVKGPGKVGTQPATVLSSSTKVAEFTRAPTQPITAASSGLKSATKAPITQQVAVGSSMAIGSASSKVQIVVAASSLTKISQYTRSPVQLVAVVASLLKSSSVQPPTQMLTIVISGFKDVTKPLSQDVSVLGLLSRQIEKNIDQPVTVLITILGQTYTLTVEQLISILASSVRITQFTRSPEQPVSAASSGFKDVTKSPGDAVVVTSSSVKQSGKVGAQPVSILSSSVKVAEFTRSQPITTADTSTKDEMKLLSQLTTVLASKAISTRYERTQLITVLPTSISILELIRILTQPITVVTTKLTAAEYDRVFTETISVPTSLFKTSGPSGLQSITVLPQALRDIQALYTQPISVITAATSVMSLIRLLTQPVSVYSASSKDEMKLLSELTSVLPTKATLAQYQRVRTQPVTVLPQAFKDAQALYTQPISIITVPTSVLSLIRLLTQPITMHAALSKDEMKLLSQLTTVLPSKAISTQYQRTQLITVFSAPSSIREIIQILTQPVSVGTVLAKSMTKEMLEILVSIAELIYVPEMGMWVYIIDGELGTVL